jgi:CheY-like chemotaxis protein
VGVGGSSASPRMARGGCFPAACELVKGQSVNKANNGMTPHGPITVLLVDDNPDLLMMLGLSLKTLGGYRIIKAEDGIAGLELAVQEHPDCMVIDVLMPGLDGYHLVRALRGDPETADIPLILLTALAEDTQQFTGFAAGADQYLTKPAAPQTIVAAIQQAISLTQVDRARALQHLVNDGQGAS